MGRTAFLTTSWRNGEETFERDNKLRIVSHWLPWSAMMTIVSDLTCDWHECKNSLTATPKASTRVAVYVFDVARWLT